MPGARRRRYSQQHCYTQVDAQFAFVVFPYRSLVLDGESRDADYKYPETRTVTTGLCLLEREELTIDPPPHDDQLTFAPENTASYPTSASTGADWIARWDDFAEDGYASLKPGVLERPGDYVRLKLPGGYVSAGFVAEPIARISFDYGEYPEVEPYAQEIVVTLEYDDKEEYVTLRSTPFDPPCSCPGACPTDLRFAWYDESEIRLLFGNGSLPSIKNVLEGSFAGHDHEGDYDEEFGVIYDVVDCIPDGCGHRPLPKVMSQEVLKIPCVGTMTALPSQELEEARKAQSDRKLQRRQPGEPFRRRKNERRSRRYEKS
jgi:hypothetical protein